MPELPEAETIARGLAKCLIGENILKVKCRRPNLRRKLSPISFKKYCVGRDIVDVVRRGKGIIIELSGDTAILIQLGMTGSCRVVDESEAFRKHDHVIFYLASGKTLRYEDPRRFGMVEPFSHLPVNKIPLFLQNLGAEPFGEEFTPDYLFSISKKRRCSIKELILNQKVVVGIGNIYASEILFRAKIAPVKKAEKIAKSDIRKIVRYTKNVLKEAIEAGGTTISDYRDVDGSEGKFVQSLRVYGKDGEPCPVCKQKIIRSIIGGRATFFCEKCQL